MKHILWVLIALACSLTSNAQNFIVTQSGDTINGKIIKSDKNIVKIETQNSSVTTTHQFNRSEIKEIFLPTSRYLINLKSGFTGRKSSYNGAISQLQQKGASLGAAKKYYNSLATGYNLQASAYYIVNPHSSYLKSALGISYRLFSSEAKYNGVFNLPDNIHISRLALEEKIFIHFFGPSYYTYQQVFNEKWRLACAATVGIVKYRDEAIFFETPTLITGNSLGIDLQLALQYLLTPNLALNIDTSFFTSNLKEAKIETIQAKQTIKLEGNQTEDLGTYCLSIGLSFFF